MPSEGGGKQSSSRPTFVFWTAKFFRSNRDGIEKVRFPFVPKRWREADRWSIAIGDRRQPLPLRWKLILLRIRWCEPCVDLSYEGCRYGITLGRKTGSVTPFGRMRRHPLQETRIEAVLETPSLSRTRWIIKENGLGGLSRTGYRFIPSVFFFIILECVFNLGKDDLEIERSLLDSKRESNREEV